MTFPDIDTLTSKVWGPLATTSSRHVTQARVMVVDGRLFVAESRQRGAIITSVTEYPAPAGEPVRDPRRSQGWSWGEWRWESCGCGGHSWRKHPIPSLIAQAVPSPDLAELRGGVLVTDEPDPDEVAAPPIRPDVDLIDNAEGNKKILAADRAAAEKANAEADDESA